jgi:hypothetical protein
MICVTQKDIERGCQSNAVLCPIARAAARRIRGLGFAVHEAVASVGFSAIELYVFRAFGWKRYTYRLPSHARRFVLDFDLGNHVEFFSFEAELV